MPGERQAIEALSAGLGLPLSRIGAIEAGDAKLVVRGADGAPMQYRRSYDHFREPR